MDPVKCSHCGHFEFVRGIRVGQTAEVGKVGLSYQSSFFLTGTEPLLADLCTACGTVHRFWVEKADQNWHVAKK